MIDTLYSLISLEDFKAILGVDDRDDKISRFCLVTATHTIEQYCKRWLLRKKHFERIAYTEDLILVLREYPVIKMLAVFLMRNEQLGMSNVELLEPEFYEVVPDCGTDVDLPSYISLSPALKRYKGLTAIKIIYQSGYSGGDIPGDLAAACLELAAWNMNRYRGRRIGMTGNIRGGTRDGEHFEISMPENVKALIEPYKRRLI